MPCELCGHVFAQKHRIRPGEWGGTYSPGNLAMLCPNHHAAVHLLMRWRFGGPSCTDAEDDRIDAYREDDALMAFWQDVVQPVVIARMLEEGRWAVGAIPLGVFPSAPADARRELAGLDLALDRRTAKEAP